MGWYSSSLIVNGVFRLSRWDRRVVSFSIVCAVLIWNFARVSALLRFVSTCSLTWLAIPIYLRVSLRFWLFVTALVNCALNVLHILWDNFSQSSTASLSSLWLLNWSMPWKMSTLYMIVSCRNTKMVRASFSNLKYTFTRSAGSHLTLIFLYCLRIYSPVSSSSQKFSYRCLIICCGVSPPSCPLLSHRFRKTGLGKMYLIIRTTTF